MRVFPPKEPLFPNPVHTVWNAAPTPNTMYMPVYTGSTIMTPNVNFYLFHQATVGAIVPTRKKYLPIKYWLLCDGTVMPKKNYEMLYYRIRGIFGDYDDDSFTLPRYEYDNNPLEDDDIVWIIRYYKRIPGRGGQQEPNTNEKYYYVVADADDQNPGYLDAKLDKMFQITDHKLELVDTNDDKRRKNVLYYYGTYKGQLGYWPWPFQFNLKHVPQRPPIVYRDHHHHHHNHHLGRLRKSGEE